MKLKLARPFEGGEEADMRKMILNALGWPFNLHLIHVDDIPRHLAGSLRISSPWYQLKPDQRSAVPLVTNLPLCWISLVFM